MKKDIEEDFELPKCPSCGSDAVGYDGFGSEACFECFQCDHNWVDIEKKLEHSTNVHSGQVASPDAEHLLAAVRHADSDIDAELYHEEVNQAEKRECRYCGNNTNTIEDECCYTCYRQHCR
jgi:hypothetical protein